MATLSVPPEGLVAFAEEHRDVAHQIESALAACARPIADMPTAYGPVAEVFLSAIAGFQEALETTGSALIGGYQQMEGDLQTAAGRYVASDLAGRASIADSDM